MPNAQLHTVNSSVVCVLPGSLRPGCISCSGNTTRHVNVQLSRSHAALRDVGGAPVRSPRCALSDLSEPRSPSDGGHCVGGDPLALSCPFGMNSDDPSSCPSSQISTNAPTKPYVATTASARTRKAPSAASATKATPTRRAIPADVSVSNSA